MGLMDKLGGLMGKKTGGASAAGTPGGFSLPGGMELPGGLGALSGGKAGMLKVLLPMLAGGGALGSKLGGLGGILGKLQSSGLGAKAQSWVGAGANEPVDPVELEQALGRENVAEFASEAGVSHDEARDGLAGLLPKVVDNLTPGGELPAGDQLGGAVSRLDLASLLG